MEKVSFNDNEFDTPHEAICSALFDKYKWRWTRPNESYSGWRPDFRLEGETVVLVECKGALEWDSVKRFQELPRYEDAVTGTNYQVLLIPKSPKQLKNSKGYDVNALGFLYDGQMWSHAELGRWSGQVGFCHSANSWKDRMSGEDADRSWGDGKRPDIELDWHSAIQAFKGRRVSYFKESVDSEIEYWDMSGEQREPW